MIELQEILKKIRPYVLGWIADAGGASKSLRTPLTSTDWDGDEPHSTVSTWTLIDLSATFGVPAGVTEVTVRVLARDSGSVGAETWIGLGAGTSTLFGCRSSGKANDFWAENSGPVACDDNGDIWYKTSASGAGTLDVFLQITGYKF